VGTRNSLKITKENLSFNSWIVLAFMMIFLVVAPFNKALFNGGSIFEGPIVTTLVWSSLVLIIFGAHFLKIWKVESFKSVYLLLISLIPLSYWISSLQAASNHLASLEVQIHIMCSLFFVLGLYYLNNRISLVLVKYTILYSGFLITIFGLLHFYGVNKILFIDLKYNEVVLGERLAGVFQYPNTYAAFLTALMLGTAFFMINRSSKLSYIIHSFMLVPIVLSFLVTYSRAGYVTLLVIVLITLVLIPLRKQVELIFYLCVAFLVSILLVGVTEIGNGSSLLILIITSLVVSIIFCYLKLYTNPFRRIARLIPVQTNIIERSNIYIPIVLVILLVLFILGVFLNFPLQKLLPSSIYERIASVNLTDNSFGSRLTYYLDAWKMIKNNLVLGSGGGAWSTLYETYRSYPYTSRQAHNLFLQYVIEVGVVGFILFMSLIIVVTKNFIKHLRLSAIQSFDFSKMIFIVFPIAILTHGILDFDFSFIFIKVLVFLCLGVMASIGIRESEESRFLIKISNAISKYKVVIPVLIVGLGVMLLFTSYTKLSAKGNFNTAIQLSRNNDTSNVYQFIEKSVSEDSDNPTYVFQKAIALLNTYKTTKEDKYLTQAQSVLNNIAKLEPYNKSFVELQYSLYLESGQFDKAITELESSLVKFPFETSFYERLILQNYDIGLNGKSFSNVDPKNEYWKTAIEIYQSMMMKREGLEEMTDYEQRIFRRYRLTVDSLVPIVQIYLLNGEYQEVNKIWKDNLTYNFTIENNVVLARWYMASVLLQHSTDDDLYRRLINKNPDEKTNIDNIVQLVTGKRGE
jgi:O-antigen ligase/tetratricopeptide (TPR) repeat protein